MLNFTEVSVWMSNYIILFCMVVITHPGPNIGDDEAIPYE